MATSKELAKLVLWRYERELEGLRLDKKIRNMGLPTSILLGVLQVQIGDYQIPPSLQLENLSIDSIKAMIQRSQAMRDVFIKSNEPGKAFKTLTALMATKQDVGYASNGRHYSGWGRGLENWEDWIGDIDGKTKEYYKFMLKQKNFNEACETVKKFFEEMLHQQRRVVNL